MNGPDRRKGDVVVKGRHRHGGGPREEAWYWPTPLRTECGDLRGRRGNGGWRWLVLPCGRGYHDPETHLWVACPAELWVRLAAVTDAFVNAADLEVSS